MFNRRKILKSIAGIGVFVLTPLGKLVNSLPLKSTNTSSDTGELYEGFVLLDLDAPIPFFVEGAPSPIMGELSADDKNNPNITKFIGKSVHLDKIDDLKGKFKFPLYIPDPLPEKLKLQNTYITSFASGQVWEVRINYGVEGNNDPLVSLSARTMFYHPFPVWPLIAYPQKGPDELILDEEYFLRKPEKINFTPRKGIMLTTDEGYILQWIKKDILYSLSVQYDEWRDKPDFVSKLLTEK